MNPLVNLPILSWDKLDTILSWDKLDPHIIRRTFISEAEDFGITSEVIVLSQSHVSGNHINILSTLNARRARLQ